MNWHDRFWSKVHKTDGCWEWTASCNAGGYGSFGIDRRTYLAHRLSWGMANAKDPGEMLILHRCDNARCVRPEHLYIGTQAQNVADRDMRKRGRWVGRKGISNTGAKLTDEKVRALRAARASGSSYTDLSAAFGVNRMVAWRIVHRKSWSHVM